MALAWEIPNTGYAKINVHYIEPELPSPIGNLNAHGIVVRNSAGEKI